MREVLTRLAEKAEDLIYRYTLRPRRGFEYVSPSSTKITGYTPEEHYADPDLGLKLVHPDDRPILERMFKSPPPASEPAVIRWVRKDGNVIWTEQRNVFILNDRGEVVAIEGIARDITENKRMEERLRAEKEFTEAILETANALIVGLDPERRIVLFNRKCEEVTGWRREEAKGMDWIETFVPEQERAMVGGVFDSMKDGEGLTAVNHVLSKDGERLIRWHNTVVKNNGEWTFVGIGGDITEEEETRSRMEDLNETMMIVHSIFRHDVLNDLNVAGSALELFKLKGESKYLDMAQKALQKSVRLVQEMRELEAIASVGQKLRPRSARKTVEDLRATYSFEDLTINLDGDCTVLADGALSSVFDNLIQNAVIHGRTKRIDIKIRKKGKGRCEIRVADFGTGIPVELRERLFQKGFRSKEKGHLGLGLFIARKVMERYGGTIAVEENNPTGAVFVLTMRTGGE